jgi:hypothetical protein
MSNNIKTLIEFIFLVLGYYETLKAKDWYRKKNLMWLYWAFAIIMPIFLLWLIYMYISKL